MERINFLKIIEDRLAKTAENKTVIVNKTKCKRLSADSIVEVVYNTFINDDINVLTWEWVNGKKTGDEVSLRYLPPESIIKSYGEIWKVAVPINFTFNWDNFLFGETLTTGYWSGTHYKIIENTDAIWNAQIWWNEEINKKMGPFTTNNLSQKQIKEHLKLLYREIPIKDRISAMMEFFLKRYYYWSLDFKYALMIYQEYTKETKDWELSISEKNKIINKIPGYDDISCEEWGKLEKLSKKEVYSSLYWEIVDSLAVSDEDIGLYCSPHWKVALGLFASKNVRRALIINNKKRADGYQYKHIKHAYDEITNALNDPKETSIMKYWFESLFGVNLCIEEGYYYELILGAYSRDRQVKMLLEKIFEHFNNFPNICSRAMMLREFMEVVSVYKEQRDEVIRVLNELLALLPEFEECMNLLYSTIVEKLFAVVDENEISLDSVVLYNEWYEQFGNGESRIVDSYTEMQKNYIRGNDREYSKKTENN